MDPFALFHVRSSASRDRLDALALTIAYVLKESLGNARVDVSTFLDRMATPLKDKLGLASSTDLVRRACVWLVSSS